MMVKVLYVHWGDEWIRGSERVLLEILSRAKAYDITPIVWTNVKLVSAACRDLSVPTFQDDFSIYFDYGSPRFSPRRYWRMVRRAIDLARCTGAELIHCNSAAPTQWCLPVSWFLKLPLLVHLHAPYLRRSRAVTGIALADHIVGVSNAILSGCRSDGVVSKRLQVILNGISPGRLLEQTPQDIRALLGLAPNSVIVAIIGSLIHRKGHDILFDAFDRIAERFPDLHLAVIGSGPAEAALRERAASRRINFLGECNEIGALLKGGIDFLVISSRSEAASLVAAEAALFGIPCIGSNVGGIPEMIRDGVTGVLVPPEDPAALAGAMEKMIEEDVWRRRLGEAAKDLFYREFHSDRMVAELALAYQSMLTDGSNGFRSIPARLWEARGAWINRG
jgi:glycosyltransferase involved in cell wall biosynthesis